MAWFRRNKQDEGVEAPGPVATEHDGTDVIRQERPSVGDWMAMPPMATTGPIQPTFRVQTLPEILTSHHSPAVSGSLGHAVSADAPSGTVSGLALYTGARSSSSSATDAFTLRTPHPPTHEEELAPLARPLPSVAAEALPISRLPEPAVSRSASNPLPLASPVTAGRDVPVARVIEAPASRATVSTSVPTPASAFSPSTSEMTGSASAPASAPTGGAAPISQATPDLRVGGFDLSALDPVGDASGTELLTSRPADLAPPIQPRTLQRRTSGARPIEIAPHLLAPSAGAPAAPLLGEDEPGTAALESRDRFDGDAPLTGQRLVADPSPSSAGPDVETLETALGAASPLPLVAPRSAAPAAVGSDPVPVSRLADPAMSAPTTTTAHDGDQADADPETDADNETNAGNETNVDDEMNANVDEVTVSTLGLLAPSSSPAPLSSTGETTRAQIGSPAGTLPLAPADWQERLDAPAGRTSMASSSAPSDVSPGASMSTVQRQAPMTLAASRPIGAGANLASLSPLAPSTTSVAQRMAAAAAAPSATAATTLAGALGSSGSSGPARSSESARSSHSSRSSGSSGLPATLARPGGSPATATSGPSVFPRSPAPESDLPDMITADTLLASRQGQPFTDAASDSSPDAPNALTDTSGGFTLQRSAGTTPPSASAGSNSSRASAMPLHTPAAAIPSATDVAVSAGLAERGPDGSIRYPHVPVGAEPSVQREIVVQRSEGTSGEAMEVRAQQSLGEPAPAASPPAASIQEQTEGLADQARKLYPHIRSQLESDIRRQLEARNRANRPT